MEKPLLPDAPALEYGHEMVTRCRPPARAHPAASHLDGPLGRLGKWAGEAERVDQVAEAFRVRGAPRFAAKCCRNFR